tara:strand:+ start:81 stop:1715 length:1635 start_codon:yes stop_codon:yes gene_type:complete
MVNNEIFLGSGASTTLIPEQDIYIPLNGTGGGVSTVTVTPDNAFDAVFKFVPNIYIGCNIDIYTAANALISSHTVASNAVDTITLSSNVGSGTPAYALLRAYGSPSPHPEVGGRQTLLGDNYLGLMESVTFPNLSQELKQMNLGLGGTRNFTFQYKGIRTADNGSLALVANTGVWLYYTLGACSAITYTANALGGFALKNVGGASLADEEPVEISTTANSAEEENDVVFIEGSNGSASGINQSGPLFYRTQKGSNVVVPPLDHSLVATGTVQALARTNGSSNLITYTFGELNTDQLPSFSMEQSMAKDPASLTTNANIGASPSPLDESNNFVRIARGCRINSLTIEAAEGEELKMNMDINARVVDSISDLYASASLQTDYVSRAGQTNNANLFNFNAGLANGAPFFFSQGTFSAFGQQFLKVNSVSITMNNNLMDKRYMGGHRDMKEGIPAQRSYEITFEAVVTDDSLFKEMLNETENTGANHVVFVFTKPDTNERITLDFKDYFLDTTEITIPDDKGPISFSSTIKPRNLHACSVVTDNVLLG